MSIYFVIAIMCWHFAQMLIAGAVDPKMPDSYRKFARPIVFGFFIAAFIGFGYNFYTSWFLGVFTLVMFVVFTIIAGFGSFQFGLEKIFAFLAKTTVDKESSPYFRSDFPKDKES